MPVENREMSEIASNEIDVSPYEKRMQGLMSCIGGGKNAVVEFKNGFRCGESLKKAINSAGGRFDEEILNMTVKDFICKIAAQNNIDFVYTGSK